MVKNVRQCPDPTKPPDRSIKTGDNMSVEQVEARRCQEVARLQAQLDRANRIIGWMMPYIGNMAPPDGGLGDLNDHFMENKVPEPKREKCDRPIKQSRLR